MKSWTDTLREGFTPPAIQPSMSLGEAVSTTAKAVAEHLLQSKLVQLYLEGEPKGTGTSCLDSPVAELVKYVATQRGDVDKSDPVLNLAFHKEFIMPVFEFERWEMLNAISWIKDISKAERDFFKGAMRLAHFHDQLWAAWFERIAAPYQMLNAEGKSRYEQRAKSQLGIYDYTAFDFDSDEGCIERVAWVQAFPEHIWPIVGVLVELGEHPDLHPALTEYFGALGVAYLCENIALLEAHWADVDRAWVKIPTTCRIIPVHGMESGYEHPFCVSPEFRLEVRTDESRDVIERSRKATIGFAEEIGLGQESIDATAQKLEHIDIGVFVNAFRAGVSLNFRYAGQAVPNRQDIVTDIGGRIFIDQAGQYLGIPTLVEYLDKHCTKATAESLKPFITARNMCIHTVVHEYAHPVGRTKESDAALGKAGMHLEEAKASLLGVGTDEWRDSSDENRKDLIAVTVARLIRFMRKNTLGNPTAALYVLENLVAATTLFESGVLKLTSDGVEVDLDRQRTSAWFNELYFFNKALLKAYQEHDVARIQSMVHRYCDRDREPISGLIKWVNRE